MCHSLHGHHIMGEKNNLQNSLIIGYWVKLVKTHFILFQKHFLNKAWNESQMNHILSTTYNESQFLFFISWEKSFSNFKLKIIGTNYSKKGFFVLPKILSKDWWLGMISKIMCPLSLSLYSETVPRKTLGEVNTDMPVNE